jgi:hypothetical protein
MEVSESGQPATPDAAMLALHSKETRHGLDP